MRKYNPSPRQEEGFDLLCGDALHVLLLGGARSGKTVQIVRAVIMRAMAASNSSHAIFRQTFNSCKSSLIFGTVPMVLDMCFEWEAPRVKLNQQHWCHIFPNGSRIYYGGLDEAKDTDKILGQEHATIYLNECSQISYTARNKAMTRLSQHCIVDQPDHDGFGQRLRLKMYYDENPPSKAHWTYPLFVQGVEPSDRSPVNKDDHAWLRINPEDNIENLDAATLKALEALPAKEKVRFLRGEFTENVVGALWTYEDIKRIGKPVTDEDFRALLERLKYVVIAVDPSGCSGDEDKRSDEVGIVVVGLGYDNRAYVLDDLSGRYAPEQWARVVASAYDRWEADTVVGETNFGGDMVRAVVQAQRKNIPFKKVTASRGKHVRAEPVSTLYRKDKVSHVGTFVDLETQMMEFSNAGYMGDRSPDRADALIWGVTYLMIEQPRGDFSTKAIEFGIY